MLIIKNLMFLVCGCLLSSHGWTQASSQRIVNTLDRGDYEVIPSEAFRPDVVGVVQQVRFDHKPIKGEIPLTFSWFSICTDGHYTVTVTPEQIYLTTGHENPNPNHLYWVLAVTKSQYEVIKHRITSRPPIGFLDLSKELKGTELAYKSKSGALMDMPSGWSDKQYQAYCISELNSQLANIFQLLNSPFAKPVFYRPKDTPRLISYMRQEIFDWLPQQVPKK